ncbi:3-ketoacyl-CoA thiolase [Aeropyrum camini SY1 = JCM 12091]|uniref:3-ketoacyl-CoA thiolase n=1 Tax=Aeropyrum camini SY1 = JCM 12091 TaxID=1198449 RepID=U3TF56_9CREN|nr:3-ketoacyl-CoA thiolase [Aeropyrum camini SY1 = JCM 12091]
MLNVAIKSVGMVRVGRHFGSGAEDLAKEALEAALSDAGWSRIDAVVVSSFVYPRLSGQADIASYIASSLGFGGATAITVEAGEASGLAAAVTAARLAAEGKRVVLLGVDKMSDAPSSRVYSILKGVYNVDWDGVYPISHAAIHGLLADLYMSMYGVDRDTLSYWPALMHSNAKENPYAMLRFAIKPEAVKDAMPVALPLTMLDTFAMGDGAAAVALSRGDGGLAVLKSVEAASGPISVSHLDDPLVMPAVKEAWDKARSSAGIRSVDVLEIHDSYTITGIIILESLGLAEKGTAAIRVAEGYFTSSGEGPTVNASGGLKARGHTGGATGVYMLGEVAMQLAGVFPGVSAPDARSGAAVSINGHGSSAYIAVLASDKS